LKTRAKNLPENSQDFVSFKTKYRFEKALSKSKFLNKTDLDFEGRTVQFFLYRAFSMSTIDKDNNRLCKNGNISKVIALGFYTLRNTVFTISDFKKLLYMRNQLFGHFRTI
jgi:hypothetical protein